MAADKKDTTDNKNKKNIFVKYWWVWVSLLIIGVAILIFVLTRGDGNDGDSGVIFDPNDLGMFIFTMIDENDKGSIIPIMISSDNDLNSAPASDWFEPGIIRGITPNFNSDTNTFSVTLTPKARSEIQSISFAKSPNNDYLLPNFGKQTPNTNQFNYIILGELDTSENTNTVLNLFQINGTGVLPDLTKFNSVDSGQTSFNSMKTIIQDNLEFNGYCTERKTTDCDNLIN